MEASYLGLLGGKYGSSFQPCFVPEDPTASTKMFALGVPGIAEPMVWQTGG